MLIKTDFCLKPFNTFAISAYARQLSVIGFPSDLAELYDEGKLSDDSVLILGEGSNILFTKHYEGLVLLNQVRKMEVIEESDQWVCLKVNGGENWSALVDYTVSQGWGGLENLSLIPGTVGAAPVQNIGAYGVELKEVLFEVEAFDMQTGSTKIFSNKDCAFGYRSSIFKTKLKGRFFILSVLLRLSKQPKPNLSYAPLKKAFDNRNIETIQLKEVSDAVKAIRRSKLPDPEILGNAGSFFKNPVVPFTKIEELVARFPDMPFYKQDDKSYKVAAGWLIEKAGWKGKRIGDAGVHEKQALVLVNHGNASGEEIFKLSEKVQESVNAQFGIKMDREVTVL